VHYNLYIVTKNDYVKLESDRLQTTIKRKFLLTLYEPVTTPNYEIVTLWKNVPLAKYKQHVAFKITA